MKGDWPIWGSGSAGVRRRHWAAVSGRIGIEHELGLWALGRGSWALGLALWALGLGVWALGLGWWALGPGTGVVAALAAPRTRWSRLSPTFPPDSLRPSVRQSPAPAIGRFSFAKKIMNRTAATAVYDHC